MRRQLFTLALVASPLAIAASPDDPGAAVDRWIVEKLRDPGSVQQYAVSEPSRCNVGILGKKWCVCWQVNAKNGMGGYAGVQRFVGWFDKPGERIAGATEAVRYGLGAHCLAEELTPRDLPQ